MNLVRLLSTIAFAGLLSACGGGGGSSSAGSGTLSVKMTDAPAPPEYAKVFVTVEKLRVHRNQEAAEAEGGWEEIVVDPPAKVDLLTLRNGVLAELGDVVLPTGRYTQMRLVLGDAPSDNTVVLAADPGTEVPLTTPSGQTSGLKLIHPFEIGADETVELVLDFDAARSVVKAGNSGKYLLKPVIAVIAQATSGAVAGSFDDPSAAEGASVSLQAFDPASGTVEVIRSTVVDAAGAWTLTPVPAADGLNLVVAKPGYRTVVLTAIDVTAGGSIAVPSLPLEPATERLVDGLVDPPATALVRALQKVVDEAGDAADLSVEVAFATSDAESGAFASTLAAEAALVAAYAASAPSFVDAANAGLYTLMAAGDPGNGFVDVDVTTGDITGLVIPLAP